MSDDDRIFRMLRQLGATELAPAADRGIRIRLETAWTARRAARPRGWLRLVPVAFALTAVLAFGGAVRSAGADSPLWDTRVALEDAAAVLQLSADDRLAYLLDLVQARIEEAARQEAAGRPDAAAKARAASSAALAALRGSLPSIDSEIPTEPTPSPSPALSPSPSGRPSPTPSATAHPPTPTPLPTARPTPTPFATVKPTPTPTKPPPATVTIYGTVQLPDGTPANGACITTTKTTTGSCVFLTRNGGYAFSGPASPGQSITLYAWINDPTLGTLVGSTTATVIAPTTIMPTITLRR